MRKGELFLKPWAAPTERSAAPIDLNNMVVNVNMLERNTESLYLALLEAASMSKQALALELVTSSGLVRRPSQAGWLSGSGLSPDFLEFTSRDRHWDVREISNLL
jgi:hypothetical protein